MRMTIFGLSVSSTWGNGHGALWRALIGGLLRGGHRVSFFERDVPYYAAHRDLDDLPDGGRLVLYRDWSEVAGAAYAALAESDVGMITSYCPDALAAETVLHDSGVALRCFYDLDTPVTLARLNAGESVPYIGPNGLRDYHLALSYTGGAALDRLRGQLGARTAAPLYGSVDPRVHHPAEPRTEYRALLSYLGTYAEDRQAALERLFVEPARQLAKARFVIGGAQYPADFPWTDNIFFVRHLPPAEHASFYSSARMTLNVTRAAMAAMGWCPSGRLFEAAACGVPILSDDWDGLDSFFEPEREILVAHDTEEAIRALTLSDTELAAIARRARERVLDEHGADRRSREMVATLEAALAASPGG